MERKSNQTNLRLATRFKQLSKSASMTVSASMINPHGIRATSLGKTARRHGPIRMKMARVIGETLSPKANSRLDGITVPKLPAANSVPSKSVTRWKLMVAVAREIQAPKRRQLAIRK